MNPSFHIIDFVIVGIYAILLVGVGLWVSRTKKGHTKTAEDYFLASKALPWWAIGSSLIAANISAEQFIGMSGSGFAGGLAIASYEFMAAYRWKILPADFYQTRDLHDSGICGKTVFDQSENHSGCILDRSLCFCQPDFCIIPGW